MDVLLARRPFLLQLRDVLLAGRPIFVVRSDVTISCERILLVGSDVMMSFVPILDAGCAHNDSGDPFLQTRRDRRNSCEHLFLLFLLFFLADSL